MSNDNYMAAVSHFGTGSGWGFRSPDAGDFNSTANGAFGAQVVFVPRGSVQASIVPQFLWGNRDEGTVPNSGWSLRLEDNAGQLALVGEVGHGAGFATVQANLTGAGTPAWAERAICAGLWLQIAADPVVYLTINGMVVARSDLAAPFSASNLPVSLGVSPVTPADEAATDVDIVSAAYTYNIAFSNVGDIGDFSSRAFAAERAAFGGNALDPAFGIDWVHRYSAKSLGQGLRSTISKTPTGARLVFDALPNPLGFPGVPDAPWPDVGNLLVSDPSAAVPAVPYSPINLNRIGLKLEGFVVQPVIVGRKNVDWYSGGSYIFA